MGVLASIVVEIHLGMLAPGQPAIPDTPPPMEAPVEAMPDAEALPGFEQPVRQPVEDGDALGWDETDEVLAVQDVEVTPPPVLEETSRDSICEEEEKLLHDDATNLGRGEVWLRDALAARGCPADPADKKSTNAVLFGEYPYAGGADGYILRRVPYWWSDPTGPRLFSGQVSAEGAYARGGVWGATGHLRGSLWRVGIETSHAYHGDRSGETNLYYGDVHFVIAPVLRQRAVWWIGMGAAWSDQSTIVEAEPGPRARAVGMSGTTSLDVFPIRPIVLSARVTAGRHRGANHIAAHVLQGRATAGLMLRRFELYGGYEAKRIGLRSLHGPVVGARTWF